MAKRPPRRTAVVAGALPRFAFPGEPASASPGRFWPTAANGAALGMPTCPGAAAAGYGPANELPGGGPGEYIAAAVPGAVPGNSPVPVVGEVQLISMVGSGRRTREAADARGRAAARPTRDRANEGFASWQFFAAARTHKRERMPPRGAREIRKLELLQRGSKAAQ